MPNPCHVKPQVSIDTCGLLCPQPLLQLKRQLKTMHSGELLELTLTDAHSNDDIGHFVKRCGHVCVLSEQKSGVYRYLIQKGN